MRLFVDLEQDADVVAAMAYDGSRKFLVASYQGNGFIVPESDVLGTIKLAAGALLSPGKGIPPGELWVGRPAKFHRAVGAAQLEKIRFQTERYCRLAERHRAELSKS